MSLRNFPRSQSKQSRSICLINQKLTLRLSPPILLAGTDDLPCFGVDEGCSIGNGSGRTEILGRRWKRNAEKGAERAKNKGSQQTSHSAPTFIKDWSQRGCNKCNRSYHHLGVPHIQKLIPRSASTPDKAGVYQALRNSGYYKQFMLLATWIAWRTVTFVFNEVLTN
jgi:hypothetical protein